MDPELAYRFISKPLSLGLVPQFTGREERAEIEERLLVQLSEKTDRQRHTHTQINLFEWHPLTLAASKSNIHRDSYDDICHLSLGIDQVQYFFINSVYK